MLVQQLISLLIPVAIAAGIVFAGVNLWQSQQGRLSAYDMLTIALLGLAGLLAWWAASSASAMFGPAATPFGVVIPLLGAFLGYRSGVKRGAAAPGIWRRTCAGALIGGLGNGVSAVALFVYIAWALANSNGQF